MSKYKFLLILFLLTLGISSPAYAYLDPGTGSVMLQGLLAGIVSGLAIVKIYWQRLKQFFVKIFVKKNAATKVDDTDSTTKFK